MQHTRLFVGNLSYDWPTEQLHQALLELFSQYGQVLEIHIPKHPDSGKHKGIAFITMEDETAATNSKNGLDGQNFGPYGQTDNSARALHVDYARPKDNSRKHFDFSRKPRNNSFSRRSRY
jgi:RNA recognition motif-containing protein